MSGAPLAPDDAAARRRPGLWKRTRRELRVRALLLGLPAIALLPFGVAVWLGGLLGRLAWYASRRQRTLALEHLAVAFPERDIGSWRQVGRESFANLGRSAVETMLARKVQKTLPQLMQLDAEGEALVRAAHAEGRGVVLVSCHVGSWELFARRIAALGLPCATVAKEANDPRLTALLERARAEAGVRVFWRGAGFSARELLRFLKSGGLLGVLIDQDTRVAGHFVPFFGRLAFTPRAAGDLAARLGAPMIFGCAHRVAPGVHRVVVRKIEVARTGDREADSLALTGAATAAIEAEVRARPDEWVWMHPRWKTRQPI